MRDTWPLLEQIAFPPIRRGRLDTLQVNVGYRCNQSCVHCHVNAGPNRTEEMPAFKPLMTAGLLSTQMMWLPISARQAAVTNPT